MINNYIYCMNPCGEISLEIYGTVVPWVQVQMTNHFRVMDGRPPFTADEIEKLERELTEAIEQAKVDKVVWGTTP
jgi:hypothetical protein